MANEQLETTELLTLTSEIVASHVSNNTVPVAELPNLIAQVFGALSGLTLPPEAPKEELRPAVPIKKSVTDDYIVCLEDGKKMKMLKRQRLAKENGLGRNRPREA